MKLLIKTIVLSLLFSSCTKDIDFNQVDQLEITPKFSFALVKFDFDQTDLIDRATNLEIKSVTDRAVFSGLSNIDQKHKDYLEKIEVKFEIQNPFNRNFELDFTFFDTNGQQTYKFTTIRVTAGNVYKNSEEIIFANHSNILNSVEAEVTMRLLDGKTIDQNDIKKLTFKTAGVLHLRINQI